MGLNYDPYSPEAMIDPRPLYAQLRAQDPVHYLPQYNAWALASFEAVWQVCKDTTNFTCRRGVPPQAALLREAGGANTFALMDPPEHRMRRRILAPGYSREAADRDESHIRSLARSVLQPLLAHGDGEMDVFGDYASRVAARTAGYKAGVPEADAEAVRQQCERAFLRKPDQRGTSAENATAMIEAFAYLRGLVASCRKNPQLARGDLARLLTGSIGGRPLTDEEIVGDLFTVLITGSETTETTVAATLYYLAQHPEQLAEVQADHSLIPRAFVETVRYDHATDILCRVAVDEVQVCGRTLQPDQAVALLWGSVGYDEAEYANPDIYDIHRRPGRSLIFGHGQHKCIGEFLAVRMGTVMLEEFFSAIASYDIDNERCRRKYAEFVKGFNFVPLHFTVRP